MVKLSVVIPVYNAELNLAELHGQLTGVLQEQREPYEIIMVDDGSKDNSLAILHHIQRLDPRVKVIDLAENYGQQHAVACGLLEAAGQQIIIMDDDLQHPPAEIPRLLHKLAEGYDLVFGIPYEKRHAWYRKIGTKLTAAVFTLAGLKDRRLKISSFRAVRQRVVQEAFPEFPAGFVYVSAQLLLAAESPVWVKVTHNSRVSGRTNYNPVKLIKLLGNLVFYYLLWPRSRRKTHAAAPTIRAKQG